MKTVAVFSASVMALGMATSFSQCATLVDDQFLDSSLANGTNAGENDVAWVAWNHATTGTSYGIATDTTTPMAGKCMVNGGNNDENTHMVASFTSTTLANTGDSLRFEFDYHHLGQANDGLQIGLYNDGGTVDTTSLGQANSPMADDIGTYVTKPLNAANYSVRSDPTAGSGNVGVFRGSQVASLAGGIDTSDNNVYHAVLILTKVAGGLQVSTRTGGTDANLVSYTIASPATYTYNELALSSQAQTSTGHYFRFDNILVTTNVPEPALAGTLMGGTALMLRRRRGQN